MKNDSTSQQITRRRCLTQSLNTTATVAAGLTILADARSVRATPANDRIELAMVG
jgi:hypothetical protein